MKSMIEQRTDKQWVVTTGPTACCFGSERVAAEMIAHYQQDLLDVRQRLTEAEAEIEQWRRDYQSCTEERQFNAAEIERLQSHLAACRELLVAALRAAGGGE